MTQRILNIIYSAVDELNGELSAENKIEKSPSATLFGSKSALDSLGLVSLITMIEERIEQETGQFISIADEKAMSMESSPFKTIETLAKYIENLLNEK